MQLHACTENLFSRFAFAHFEDEVKASALSHQLQFPYSFPYFPFQRR